MKADSASREETSLSCTQSAPQTHTLACTVQYTGSQLSHCTEDLASQPAMDDGQQVTVSVLPSSAVMQLARYLPFTPKEAGNNSWRVSASLNRLACPAQRSKHCNVTCKDACLR